MTTESRHFFEGRKLYHQLGRYWLCDDRQFLDQTFIGSRWEPVTTDAVQQLVKPGQTVLDIGANIGWYTVILSELVGDEGLVHAFEVMATPRRLVRAHIALNGVSNAIVHDCGLDEKDEDQKNAIFNYSWSRDGIVNQPRQDVVPLRKLDTLLGEDHVDFMKIDVDGYEARLLRGAEKILRRDHPVLLLEVCDYTLRSAAGKAQARKDGETADPEYGEETVKMMTFLEGIGYEFFWEEDFTPATIEEMITTKYDLSCRSINVVCATPDNPITKRVEPIPAPKAPDQAVPSPPVLTPRAAAEASVPAAKPVNRNRRSR